MAYPDRTAKNNTNYKHGRFTKKVVYCVDCGIKISSFSTRCIKCHNQHISKSGEQHPNWKGGVCSPKKCIDCGTQIDWRAVRCHKCDYKTITHRVSGKNNPMWGKIPWNFINGKSFLPYAPSFNEQTKERVRVRDNFKCAICGIPELEYAKHLDIHHINYNKKDTSIMNLICLCNKCHGNLHNGKNKEELEKKIWQLQLEL